MSICGVMYIYIYIPYLLYHLSLLISTILTILIHVATVQFSSLGGSRSFKMQIPEKVLKVVVDFLGPGTEHLKYFAAEDTDLRDALHPQEAPEAYEAGARGHNFLPSCCT